ncbi:MAG: Co2+/Mg2+ efflux protein ApaG [Gammaproteobacteria bacterium]|nr:MAG: Co2+/Mg2+ efflux protein ApaG [Gammaproteobacteria bacterium]
MKHHINVEVKTSYLPGESSPENSRYVFSYTITLTNDGETAARLLTRHWVITDANNRTQEVKGEGVIGEQPYLAPGKSFQYTSGTVFDTPIGTMEGSYQMLADDGTEFEAEIPLFSCSLPGTLH